MDGVTKTIYIYGLNKGFRSKFLRDYTDQTTLDKFLRKQRPKHCANSKTNTDNIPNVNIIIITQDHLIMYISEWVTLRDTFCYENASIFLTTGFQNIQNV